ncbi:zinc ribbon domain-containing protein [Actinomycetospora flava]|uniref:Zinc ribbon domain-containing protein n=1 Tax=Actinomycetospora flava TaxID=3129232 RepID=A0ABU8M5P8_9PSEU
MTIIDAAGVTCPRCGAPWQPGAHFCATCGIPAYQGPPSGPWASPVVPPPAPPRSSRGLIALVCVLAVVAAGLAGFLVVGQPWSPESGPQVAAAPVPTGTSTTAPADPQQALRAQQSTDAGAVEGLVGTWVPQLSAKKAGMSVGGRTYDDAAVLADHQELRRTYPDAVLAWSGDWTSFRGRDFWITLVNRPFSSGEAANAWCAQAGIGPDDCYAKRLTRSGGYGDNTQLRTGAGSAPVSGTPTLGAVWAPNQTGFGDVRPGEVYAGGSSTGQVTGVTWESWGGTEATGRGTGLWVPDGVATSDGVQRPVVVVASDLGDCHGRLAYRSVGWYFPTQGETTVNGGYEDICDG